MSKKIKFGYYCKKCKRHHDISTKIHKQHKNLKKNKNQRDDTYSLSRRSKHIYRKTRGTYPVNFGLKRKRKFGNRTFRRHDMPYDTQYYAEKEAKRMQRAGYKYRIVPVGLYYQIYVHKKKRFGIF